MSDPGRAPVLCLVTDRRRLSPEARSRREEIAGLERWLDDAFGRVSMIQIREPDLEAGELFQFAERVVNRAAGSGTRIVVNDRADVAIAAGAAGVHVKAGGPPVGRVRRLGPSGWQVGRSAHSLEELTPAAEDVPDYFIFGTVFPTASKGLAAPMQGVERLAAAVRAAAAPVLAIGGIDGARAAECLAAGAAGIAAIGVFLPPGRADGALGIRGAVDAFAPARSH